MIHRMERHQSFAFCRSLQILKSSKTGRLINLKGCVPLKVITMFCIHPRSRRLLKTASGRLPKSFALLIEFGAVSGRTTCCFRMIFCFTSPCPFYQSVFLCPNEIYPGALVRPRICADPPTNVRPFHLEASSEKLLDRSGSNTCPDSCVPRGSRTSVSNERVRQWNRSPSHRSSKRNPLTQTI